MDPASTLGSPIVSRHCPRAPSERRAGAVCLPERLAKSAQIRVLTLAADRAKLTEYFAGIPAQIRWLELEQWPFEVRKKAPK